ncbi:hypothetical protein KL867_00415 [Ruegeria litorea]|uniref:Uncharacterized protein n=1 Tax=Falsiruegeria litorea TaxID=1280831 RepID=A0ABS5WK54_9RHOB|nr:hypothetical protein [Falsiruegeria litorea]MBT3139504.1 hypothetical protein [Falsiruegeria litorea]
MPTYTIRARVQDHESCGDDGYTQQSCRGGMRVEKDEIPNRGKHQIAFFERDSRRGWSDFFCTSYPHSDQGSQNHQNPELNPFVLPNF